MLPGEHPKEVDMRWGWITIRGLWPALLLAVSGTTFAILVGRMGALGGAETFGQAADWIFTAAWGAAAAWLGLFIYRLKRWEAGDGPFCRTCSGPTGFVQSGRVYFGRQLSDFRRCYNCGKATPEI